MLFPGVYLRSYYRHYCPSMSYSIMTHRQKLFPNPHERHHPHLDAGLTSQSQKIKCAIAP